MGKLTNRDFAVAIAIAILVIAFALCVWPGYILVRAAGIEGTWASESGKLYRIRSRPDISAQAVTIVGGGRVMDGKVCKLRGLCLNNGEKGSVGLNGDITWPSPAGQDVWHPQGVKSRRSH